MSKVAVYAQHCVRAGDVVADQEAAQERQSDDYIWLDIEAARIWATSDDPFRSRAGQAVLEYFSLAEN